MAQYSVTVSSVGTTRAIALDWRNNAPIAVSVTGSSSGTFAYSVQTTLDDIMLTAASAVVWATDPGATALTSSSSAISYTTPIAAIRLNSTAVSSATLTLNVNQGLWL